MIPSFPEAFRWTAETGMTSLGSLSGESLVNVVMQDGAWGVSADGSVIARVVDADDQAVAGVLVEVAVEHLPSGQVSFESGTTGGDGTVSWRYSNANANDYKAEVISFSHPEYD